MTYFRERNLEGNANKQYRKKRRWDMIVYEAAIQNVLISHFYGSPLIKDTCPNHTGKLKKPDLKSNVWIFKYINYRPNK